LYWYGTDFLQHLGETGSTKGFAGECCAWWLWLDIDCAGDLDAALRAARALAARVLERYRALDEDEVLVFFSGSKGFHVGVPLAWRPPPSPIFHRVVRRLAKRLAGLAGVTIDSGIYDRVRPFRAPNSRHPATGLHKRRLALRELMHLSADSIRELSAQPAPFELPWPRAADPVAEGDWLEAVAEEIRQSEERNRRHGAQGAGAALNRLTMDFIRESAEEHTRALRLFSAAANLGEFGCPPALAHALLSESALDSGLPPAEVRRQIECGLRQGGPFPPPGDPA